MQRQGLYHPPPGASAYPGLECSGTVDARRRRVDGWSVGDEVCALLSGGGYAEQVAVPAGQLLPVPGGRRRSRRRRAARGGLHRLVQRLHARQPAPGRDAARARRLQRHRHHGDPARPRASARGSRSPPAAAAKLEACRELGAEILVNYREQDFVEEVARARPAAPAPTSSSTTWAPSTWPATSTRSPPSGRLVVIGLQGGTKAELDLGPLLRKRAAVIATSLRARPAGGEGDDRRGRARARLAAGRAPGGSARSSTARYPLAGRRRGAPRAGGQRRTSARCCSPPDGRSQARPSPGTSSLRVPTWGRSAF